MVDSLWIRRFFFSSITWHYFSHFSVFFNNVHCFRFPKPLNVWALAVLLPLDTNICGKDQNLLHIFIRDWKLKKDMSGRKSLKSFFLLSYGSLSTIWQEKKGLPKKGSIWKSWKDFDKIRYIVSSCKWNKLPAFLISISC